MNDRVRTTREEVFNDVDSIDVVKRICNLEIMIVHVMPQDSHTAR